MGFNSAFEGLMRFSEERWGNLALEGLGASASPCLSGGTETVTLIVEHKMYILSFCSTGRRNIQVL